MCAGIPDAAIFFLQYLQRTFMVLPFWVELLLIPSAQEYRALFFVRKLLDHFGM